MPHQHERIGHISKPTRTSKRRPTGCFAALIILMILFFAIGMVSYGIFTAKSEHVTWGTVVIMMILTAALGNYFQDR